MYHRDDAHYFEALLCTLMAQAERPIRLAAQDIANCGNHYRLGVQADWDSETVTLSLVDPERLCRPAAHRLPRW